jgi:hypothetical protein
MKQYLYLNRVTGIHFVSVFSDSPHTIIGEVSEIVTAYQESKAYKSPYKNAVTTKKK